jgi:ceramide glucosyltransferase
MLDPASILVFVLLVTVAGTTLVLRRALRTTGRARAGRAARRLPPIVMIRPTKGRDPGLRANARAALAQRYPGPLETLFVLDDASDPAYPVIRDVVAAHGPGARLVLSGPPTDGRTGKLHAMIRGLEEARLDAPLVCFADSDTRPDPDLLADLAAAVMEHEDVGAAFAPVVCVDEPALGGDVGYGLLLDGLYGPQAALATDRRGSLPFIMGQTMVLRRSALAEAGGLEATEGELVDDMHIGARLEEAGYRNVLVSHPLPVVQRGLAWTEFLSVATRWFIYSRTGIPFWPFNLPSLVWATVFFGGLAGAGAALAMGAHAAAPGLALCSVSVLVAIQWLRRLQGAAPLPPRLWWALAASFAVLPGIYLRAWLARSVEWRGRVYSLDESGRLAAESSVREP